MISRQEYIDRWGDDVLCRPTAFMLTGVNIPDEQKRYLLDVGFPHACVFDVDYADLSQGVTRLAEIAKFQPEYQDDFGRYIFIGFCNPGFVCIDEAENGRVVIVKPWEFPPDFLNTSVDRLAGCLLAAQEVSRKFGAGVLANEQLLRRFEELEQAIRHIDPEVMMINSSDGGVWSYWLEEAKLGVV